MFQEAPHARLYTLGLLSVFLWLPLANAGQTPSHDDGSNHTLSAETSTHSPGDIALGFGGFITTGFGFPAGPLPYTSHQLKWFNRHCSTAFETAKNIYFTNKEFILKRSFEIATSFSEEPLIIH